MPEQTESYWTVDVRNPRDPVGRIKLSDLMNYDDRCTHKHKVVWEFHLGWAHAKYEWTSLASVRFIRDKLVSRSPSGKALSTRHISAANRDLCEWGYLSEVEERRGRRASRFAINWDLLDLAANGNFPGSVSHEGHTNAAFPPRDTQGDERGYATSDLRSPQGTQRPDYLDPAKDGAIGSSTVSSPPDADGLAATAPGEGFEAVWRAYGKYGNKHNAQATFARIDLATHSPELIEARAASWRASAKPGQKRMPLEKWLAAEKYDEADRRAKPAGVQALPKGGVRRDATIESVENDRITLRWHDAEPDESPTYRKHMLHRYRAAIAADLGVDDLAEAEGRRVLIDIFEDTDGDECEQWHWHPESESAT